MIGSTFDEGMIKVYNYPQNYDCYTLKSGIIDSISEGNQWIVNLDIDYFFNGKDQIFTDDYIVKCINSLKAVMDNIAIMTIVLSPECCGGWENSIRVYNIIAEELGLNLIIKI